MLRVALRIISHYGVDDIDVICAALLHDAVEDHAGDLAAGGRAAAVTALAGRFGPRAAGLVEAWNAGSAAAGASCWTGLWCGISGT